MSKIKNRLNQILRYTIIWAIAGIFAYTYFVQRDIPNRYKEIKRAETQYEQLVQQVRGLIEQKKMLEKEIERLKADQLKQEEMVRKNKGWVYPGEKVLRLEEQ